ncbi:large ribosomal subunit protein uL15m-like [Branchiostoma lanceolatum]|uniref:large ribosomal subunit protein uL15m-like n=1 Tax=Branchiostoma lanceolatum TaxID=7740 RepID=UPI00345174F5
MASAGKGTRGALNLLKNLPRVGLTNIKALPGAFTKAPRRMGGKMKRKCGRGHKGQGQRGTRPRLGFEGGNTPFYLRIPKYGYYDDHSRRRQYPPLSLNRLQYLIDMGRIDTTQPIDLASLTVSRGVSINPKRQHYGINLVEEGADIFQAKINIEVQYASELAIATVERNGGTISTAYYDPMSLLILCDPIGYFAKGIPIPKRALPPEDLVEYYTSAEYRGYLSDPQEIQKARLALADKYGYKLPDLSLEERFKMLSIRKDPRQILFGLGTGWLVDMNRKTVLKPTDPDLLEFYKS